MDTAVVALIIGCVSTTAGLVTLSLVLRNEFRARRELGPVLWDLNRFATRSNADGSTSDVAELVQFGRAPVRVMTYHLVGFSIRPEAGYRLRGHIKGEDTLPLLLDVTDPDDAWMLICHYRRDDRRWLYIQCVELGPTTAAFRDRANARQDALIAGSKTWKGLARRAWAWVRPWTSHVRPVGPDGHWVTRIRMNRNADELAKHIETAQSMAVAANPGGSVRPH